MSLRPSPAQADPRLNPHRPIIEAVESSGALDSTFYAYVEHLADRWRLLLLLALVGVAIGAAISRLARPVYESGVTLAVVTAPEQRADQVKAFVTLLENHTTASDIIRRFKLDEGPHNLGPEEFLLRNTRAEQIGQTNLVRLTVRLSDPKLAADVANDMAGRARDLVQRLAQEETVLARDQLAVQLAESRQRLDTAQAELERVKREGQLDLLQRDVDTLLEQRQELRNLTVKIAGARASLARAEAELGRRKRIDLLTRSIDGDTTLREAARQSGVPNVLGLQLKNEFVNQSYDDLDDRVSASRAELSGFEQQRDQLIHVSGLDAPQLTKLSQLYALETRVTRLETDIELAKRVYLEIASRYEQVRMQVAGRTATLQIVDPAFVPTRPEARHTARNAALGGLTGLLLGVLAVLILPMAAGGGGSRRLPDA